MIGRLDAVHSATGEIYQRRRALEMMRPITDRAAIPNRVRPRAALFRNVPGEQHHLAAEINKMLREVRADEARAAGDDDFAN